MTAISLLVIRHGRLVAEGYCRDLEDRYTKEHIQSETKSITSLVFGIALSLGYFESLDETLYSIIPEAFDDDVRKRGITLRHLLTMRSGIEFGNRGYTLDLLVDAPRNQAKQILKKPLHAIPGEKFIYKDVDPQLISAAIQSRSNMTLEEIAKRHIFDPLGITDYFWQSNVDGESLGPNGLFLRARDRGKIGELILRGGVVDGTALIPASWIEESTAFQIQGDSKAGEWPQVEFDHGMTYGYYWWIPPQEMNAFTTSGTGGQFTFIVPEKDLVIVLAAEPDAIVEITGIFLYDFLNLAQMIIDAIEA